ncbi:ABC transporter permease subunit [Thermosipho ferrireducens]|uniref:ABC transporter permease subunit n=1 Tax=Thermosipho ferrireducens TaxID=2571116 RepID=A0ABX7S9F8_9BACT|nr:sugar ABC transporter permease [Thermosipho ferrireducens]QTA38327.1 ABC transporter permease subunit [Thermosipho ferrireducens]
MVIRGKNWLTHIILILLIVAILFPVVWVISTSLRRDNAAFSTKLFSSRMSVQNYKDLLFPEKNIPRLLSDIEAVTTNAMPYTNRDIEFLLSKFDKDIQLLKGYVLETQQLIESSDREYEKIKEFIENNNKLIIEKIKSEAENIKRNIQVPETSEEKLYLAVLYLLDSKKLKETKLSLIKRISSDTLEKYKSKWEEKIKKDKIKLDALNTRVKELEIEISKVRKEMESYQREYLNLMTIIRESILPQFQNYYTTLQIALETLESGENSKVGAAVFESDEMENFEKLYRYILEISNYEVEDFSEYNSLITNLVKVFEKINNLWKEYPYKSTSAYADFISLIKMFNLKATKQIKESVNVIKGLKKAVDEYQNFSKSYEALNEELSSVKLEYEKVSLEFNEKISSLNEGFLYIYGILLSENVNKFIAKVENYKLPKDITKLYFALKSLRSSANAYFVYLSDADLKKIIRASLSKLEWINSYRDFNSKYKRFSKDMKDFLEDFSRYVNSIEATGPRAIKSAKGGIKLRIAALSQLFPKVQSDYPSKIGSTLGLSSKEAANLVDQFPLNELDKRFKTIDAKLFRIDQIWKQKTKHYLVRWIFNSVVVAGVVAVVTTLVNALAAYPFSRMRFKGRRYGIMSLLLIQMFPAIMYMVALYGFLSFVGRYLSWMGLNTLGGLMFIYLGNIAFNMYLIKGFYDTIPSSLEEAAMIDGATRWQTFWRIVLPLASPILAVVVILTFMGTFNEFVLARIILQDVEKYTYAVGLWTFSTGPYETEWGLFSAAALIGMAPMVILFLSMQKYLVGGLTKGSVKG